MAEVKDVVIVDDGQAFRRQSHHLADGQGVQTADALQPRLHDLTVAGAGSGPVHMLIIINLLQSFRRVPSVLDNRECHIRFQRHQLTVGIRKCEDIVAEKEPLVAHIQVIGLEFAHTIGHIAVTAIKFPKASAGKFVRPPNT